MKKILSVILLVTIIFLLCGCNDGKERVFKQEVTIVKMPSPPKCKTSDDIAVVDEVINVLGLIDKSPINDDVVNGGWSIMIKLNVDGQELNYTIGNVFADADGKQYKVNNYAEIEEKLTKIYDELDVPEANYT